MTHLKVEITFFPRDWTETDEVDIRFGRGRTVVSKELKEDAPSAVELSYPSQVLTGETIDVGKVFGEPSADLSVLLLDTSDTEDTRLSKWRLTKSLRATTPEDLNFLTTGYQSGVVDADLLSQG